MANPGGKNSPVHFEGLVQNPPSYGDKARQGDLQRSAVVAGSGASASALNTPRRAKQRATRSSQPSPVAPVEQVMQAQQGAPQTPYPVYLATAWAQIAAIPGASPLVQQLAQEAQVGGQG